MAIQTAAAVAAAVDTLLESARGVRRPDTPGIVGAIAVAASKVFNLFVPRVTLTVTDAAQANLAAFEPILRAAAFAVDGQDSVQEGDVFAVTGTGDTTDNALQTAKGSAVAAGDRFVVTNRTPASFAVAFMGNGAPTVSESLVSYD